MGNQVTIKLDSRVFYLVAALVAVVGIFAIGWWLGTQLNSGTQAAAPEQQQQPVAQAPVGQVQPVDAGALQAAQPPVDVQQVAQTAGSPPVSVEEVPVQAGEARLWLPDMADTNWTFDLGSIPADQSVEHDFTVSNVGEAELVIEEASAACGCTAALVEDSTVAPGESTTVRVSYDPRVNREFGKFVKKQVRIKSNDPIVPLVEFTITADVQPQ
jgi:hypothetical protein